MLKRQGKPASAQVRHHEKIRFTVFDCGISKHRLLEGDPEDSDIQPQIVGRATYLAPGVPEERIAAVRAAFMKTMADSDLKGDADKAKLELNPVTGDQLQASMAQLLAMPETVKARLKGILKL